MKKDDIRCLKCFNLGEKILNDPPNHGKENDCYKYPGPLARKNCPHCKKGFHFIPSGSSKQDCKHDYYVKKYKKKLEEKKKKSTSSPSKTQVNSNLAQTAEPQRMRRGPDGQLVTDKSNRRSSSGGRKLSKEEWEKVKKMKNKLKKMKDSKK